MSYKKKILIIDEENYVVLNEDFKSSTTKNI